MTHFTDCPNGECPGCRFPMSVDRSGQKFYCNSDNPDCPLGHEDFSLDEIDAMEGMTQDELRLHIAALMEAGK